MAVFGGEKIVKLLLDQGIRVDERNDDGISALHLTALEGNQAIAELLVAKGSDVDAQSTKNHLTPLYWAAKGGHLAIVELLISKGANVNSRTKRGKTPLKVAIIKGHRIVAELLLRHGARE
jgi:ankyrin repeat protein